MKFQSLLSLIICAYATSAVSAQELIQDHDYHWQKIKKVKFLKGDSNNDGVITIKDKGGWWHNKSHDANGDGKVEEEEYKTHFNTPENAGKVLNNVVYKEAGGQKCLMDIYYPKQELKENAPVLYFTHGGGWAAGSKDLGAKGHMSQFFSDLLEKGIVCVSVSYRLVKNDVNDTVVMQDCVIDAKDGMRFLAKHAAALKIDMSRVMTFGNSAGGHICLMLNYSPPAAFPGAKDLVEYAVQPVGAINWYGPSDFRESQLFVPRGVEMKGTPDRFTGRMIKGSRAVSYQNATGKVKEMMYKMSPVTYLTEKSPPVLSIHGDKDKTIPQQHSEHLVAQAKPFGVTVDYIPVSGAGHSWHGEINPSWKEIKGKMVVFATKHLFGEMKK